MSDWFYPAYKAGGPITSLNNLVKNIGDKINVTVVTSAFDLGERKILDNITPDVWHKQNGIRIKYFTNPKDAADEIEKRDYDFIYLNSMFSPAFTIKPLLKAKKNNILDKVILAPRGMLQAGALSQKWLKKKIFLMLLKLYGVTNKIHFHATDVLEKEDILKYFPKAKKITVSPNVVSKPVQVQIKKIKEKNNMHLIYLSVISSKKNLKYVIEIFRLLDFEFVFDVYGSIKDKDYWVSFTEQIQKVKNVKYAYKGDIPNHLVNETLKQYDFFILPTLGENFGHAIYEALSSGTPVIISDKTPWRDLEFKNAGWDISLADKEKFIEVLNKCYEMDNEEYKKWSNGAFNYAKKYYEENNVTEKYLEMFSGKEK